jgi:hypothetical protein
MTDPSSGRTNVDAESANRGEADERIERIYLDFAPLAVTAVLKFDSHHLEDQASQGECCLSIWRQAN